MFLPSLAIFIVGIVVGIVWERYRWVGLAKKDKLKEVDGDIYRVVKVKHRDPGGIR